MKYEFLDHVSEVKFRAFGKTLNEAFECSVLAFSKLISHDLKIKSTKKKTIEIKGSDKESLLYNLLDELIFLLDGKDFVVRKAEIVIKGNKLKAVLYGDSTTNYIGLDHVKAATYAEMFVRKKEKGWEVQAVLDV